MKWSKRKQGPKCKPLEDQHIVFIFWSRLMSQFRTYYIHNCIMRKVSTYQIDSFDWCFYLTDNRHRGKRLRGDQQIRAGFAAGTWPPASGLTQQPAAELTQHHPSLLCYVFLWKYKAKQNQAKKKKKTVFWALKEAVLLVSSLPPCFSVPGTLSLLLLCCQESGAVAKTKIKQ